MMSSERDAPENRDTGKVMGCKKRHFSDRQAFVAEASHSVNCLFYLWAGSALSPLWTLSFGKGINDLDKLRIKKVFIRQLRMLYNSDNFKWATMIRFLL